jgi:hypothetical protein
MRTRNPVPRRPGRVRRVSTSAVVLPWRAAARTWRDLVWADLRDGTLSLRGLSLGTRSLIWLGFGLLVVALGAVVANDTLRSQFPLLALRSSVVGRGSLVPIALVPLTLFLISIPWALALTGALHAHPAIRLGTVLLYVALTIGWIGQATVGSTLDLVRSWTAILLVPSLFALRWRSAARPVLEFPLLLLLTSFAYITFQAQGAESVRISGVDLLLAHLNGEVLSLTLMILPLLALAGMSVAGFTRQAAGWTVDVAGRWLPGRVLRAALAALLAWRLYEVVLGAISRRETTSLGAAALAYGGVLGVPLAVLLAWLLVMKAPHLSPPPDTIARAADRHALRVIFIFVGPQLLGFLLVTLVLPSTTLGLVPYEAGQSFLASVVGALNSDAMNLYWRLLVAGLAVAAGVVLARRDQRGLGLFLAVFGLTAALKELTVPDGPLGLLAPYGGLGALVDFWWVLSVALFGATWLVRGRLTDDRVAGLLLLLLITALLGQTDFISNRFSPFFGSGGVWFIAFGLAWDALTIGAWANQSTPALPRVSRILLYLGYSLLTVTVVNWAVSVHDLTALSRLTGEAALDGLERYGRPMLYAIFAVTLAPAAPASEPRSRNP